MMPPPTAVQKSQSYVKNGRASAVEIHDGQFTAIYLDRRDPLIVAAAAAAPPADVTRR